MEGVRRRLARLPVGQRDLVSVVAVVLEGLCESEGYVCEGRSGEAGTALRILFSKASPPGQSEEEEEGEEGTEREEREGEGVWVELWLRRSWGRLAVELAGRRGALVVEGGREWLSEDLLGGVPWAQLPRRLWEEVGPVGTRLRRLGAEVGEPAAPLLGLLTDCGVLLGVCRWLGPGELVALEGSCRLLREGVRGVDEVWAGALRRRFPVEQRRVLAEAASLGLSPRQAFARHQARRRPRPLSRYLLPRMGLDFARSPPAPPPTSRYLLPALDQLHPNHLTHHDLSDQQPQPSSGSVTLTQAT